MKSTISLAIIKPNKRKVQYIMSELIPFYNRHQPPPPYIYLCQHTYYRFSFRTKILQKKYIQQNLKFNKQTTKPKQNYFDNPIKRDGPKNKLSKYFLNGVFHVDVLSFYDEILGMQRLMNELSCTRNQYFKCSWNDSI